MSRCLHTLPLVAIALTAACAGDEGIAPGAGGDFDAAVDCEDAPDCIPPDPGSTTALDLSWADGTRTTQPRGATITAVVRGTRTFEDGGTEPLQGTVDLILSPDTLGTLTDPTVLLDEDGTARSSLHLCTGGAGCNTGSVVSLQATLGTRVSNAISVTLGAGGSPDAGRADAGRSDAGVDGGRTDAGAPDAGRTDAGAPDAGRPDAGAPDAGRPDAGWRCMTDQECSGGRHCKVSTGQCVRCVRASDCGSNATCTNDTCVSTGICTLAGGAVQLTSDPTLNVTSNSLSCQGGISGSTPTCVGGATVRRDNCFDGFVLTLTTSGTASIRLRLQSNGTTWKAGAQLAGGPTLVGNMTVKGLNSPAVPPPAGTRLQASFFVEGPSGAVTFFANGTALSSW